MTANAPSPASPMLYEVTLHGHLDEKWIQWFEGTAITHKTTGDTVLVCSVADQAALHGILRKVRDLGIPLLAVNRMGIAPTIELQAGANQPTSHSELTSESHRIPENADEKSE